MQCPKRTYILKRGGTTLESNLVRCTTTGPVFEIQHTSSRPNFSFPPVLFFLHSLVIAVFSLQVSCNLQFHDWSSKKITFHNFCCYSHVWYFYDIKLFIQRAFKQARLSFLVMLSYCLCCKILTAS